MCLTQGLTDDCNAKNAAGVQENQVYLIPKEWLNADPFTVAGDGTLSAISIDLVASGGLTGLFQFAFKKDANGYRGEASGESPNIFFEQTVTLVKDKMNQATRNSIMELVDCGCGMVAILVDNNCKQWVLGVTYRAECTAFICKGLRYAAGSAEQTGIDPTADNNQYEITLTGLSWELAREYTGVIPVNP